MAIMMAKLYSALISAGVTNEDAIEAAEEAAGYEARLAALNGDMLLVKWMLGINLTLTLALVGKAFTQ